MLLYTVELLAAKNKGELREMCRTHGINYSSLNNEGMRAALAIVVAPEAAESVVEVAPPAQEVEKLVMDGTEPGPLDNVPFDNSHADALPPVATVVPRDPFVAPAAPVTKVRTPKAAQPEQNGVKRPKPGTICAQIWDWCDAQDAAGTRPEAKALRAALGQLDDTTKTVQFYRWRKFNSISGR